MPSGSISLRMTLADRRACPSATKVGFGGWAVQDATHVPLGHANAKPVISATPEGVAMVRHFILLLPCSVRGALAGPLAAQARLLQIAPLILCRRRSARYPRSRAESVSTFRTTWSNWLNHCSFNPTGVRRTVDETEPKPSLDSDGF